MFILFPVGKNLKRRNFPLATVSIIVVCTAIFMWQLSSEQAYTTSRASVEEYRLLASSLANLVIEEKSGLTDENKKWLALELEKNDFPSEKVISMFEYIERTPGSLSPPYRYDWEVYYPRFAGFRESFAKRGGTDSFSLYAYAFWPKNPFSINVVLHQFLHSGWLHLIFNMFFLWFVGCNVEDRWGWLLMLFLFVFGGIGAAFTQMFMYPDINVPMVGASGSIAALMGAFMVRFPLAKVKIFYLFMLSITPRYGTFFMPAWFVLFLWAGQQLLTGLVMINTVPAVAYWAHIGGFGFGVAAGFIIKLLNVGSRWEAMAESSDAACDEKADMGFIKLGVGEIEEALKIFLDVNAKNPRHLKALKGLIKVHIHKNDPDMIIKRTFDIGLLCVESGKFELLNDVLNLARPYIENFNPSDAQLFRFAQFFQKCGWYQDAFKNYARLAADFPSSQYYPKSVFMAAKLAEEYLNKKQEAQYFINLLNSNPEWEFKYDK